ncbi:restriction endonuclease [Kitasatospora sp. NBC_01287]|uniref:restriction endonuclease n=1 Tax=Kitasatospora sp. NBC_01287 TaxID=2903573 RepID=UPI0022594712|nr:restriction endonuclease [Kitasatospora sp. NBC_01287]MCX4745509.1 restriction endonuclease [Kitasatospora sp. NBC_01287]
MARRAGGVLALWAEAQRQEQRRQEAQRRAQAAAQRQAEQERRAAQRAAARGEQAALRAYQQGREAEAAELSAGLTERVTELAGLLRVGLGRPAFSLAPLLAPAEPPAPFNPGRLGVPVPMPDPGRYQVPPPAGLLQRRRYEEQQAQAQAQYERDWQQARAAEQERLRQLAEYRRGYQDWAAQHRRQDDERISQARELAERLGRAEDEAVREYFGAALHSSAGWPAEFPHRLALAWDAADRQLVVDRELPGFEVVPEHSRVRYVKADDRQVPVARAAAERKRIYREVLALSALRVLDELFRADPNGLLDSVALNGTVQGVDPATGRESGRVLVAVTAARSAFAAIALDRVAPVECLEGLGGRVSTRPERLAEVRAERLPHEVGARVTGQGGEEDPDLYTMDPIAFEELIAQLFRARGYQVQTTARSGDQGVDVVAVDPDPVTGGKIVIQAKRYRSTVSPTAVRDLDSTVRHHGAIKGILVTTAHFGRGSYDYIRNKPLSLVNGPELVELLAEQGLRGRLGAPAAAPAARPAGGGQGPGQGPGQDPEKGSGQGSGQGEVRVRIEWQPRTVAGDPAELDVCAFLCAGGRVLSDEHFVFFNNPAEPGGAVRLGAARTSAPGALRGAVLDLALHRLAPEVEEVVLALSTEEDPGPALPLGYLHGLALVVAERDSALELHRWAGGTSGIADSALELGAFRRAAPGGGWRFEAAVRAVPGGLAGLATGRGVAIA